MTVSFSNGVSLDNVVTAVTDAVTGAIELSVGELTVPSALSMTNPSGLDRWRAARAAAEYSVATVACWGDSVTVGTYSNDTSIPVDSVADAQGYVGRLRAKLARGLNTTPAGYIPANDSRNTLVGTGTPSATMGLFINTVRTDNVTVLGGALPLPTAATISIPVPQSTNITIHYIDSNTNSAAGGIGANTGTFSYAVDGGGATTTTADNVNPVSYKTIAITGLSDATHTLLLTGVSATCYIIGISYSGVSGVATWRLGLGSATALDLTADGALVLSAGGQQRIFGYLSSPLAPTIITGAIVSGSAVVTGIASTAGIVAGMPVGASAQLPLPCYVKSVDSASQITLTANATGTNAGRTMYVGAGTTFTPDVFVIAIGHNDWQNQNHATFPTPVSVFTAQLQRIIDQVVRSGACVLLVAEPWSNTSLPTPQIYNIEAYWDALDALAVANTHVASIRVAQRFGNFSNAVALGLSSVTGGVHPVKKGSVAMAEYVYAALMA